MRDVRPRAQGTAGVSTGVMKLDSNAGWSDRSALALPHVGGKAATAAGAAAAFFAKFAE